MGFYLEKSSKNDLWLGKFSSFEQTNLVNHGFSARFGGQSTALYDSLNLAMHVGDNPEDVFENRSRLAVAVDVDTKRICTAEQVHGEAIYRVKEDDAGRGIHSYDDAIKSTDALITNVPYLPLMMCFADCVPIMFLDQENRAIGVAHGGWKGTVKHIAEKTLIKMNKEFGTNPAKCLAVIGPSIGPCCFSVGEDVAAEFAESFPEFQNEIIFEHSDGMHIDLWAANKLQLEAVGMKEGNIELADVCTSCNSKVFYSYRADNGITGRLAAIIALK